MEETNKIDPKQLKGFNDGYLLAEHEPELAEKLAKIDAVSPWLMGMQQGREQYLNEQIKDKRPAFLRDNRIIQEKGDLNKTKSKDRGIEPEL